MDDRITLMNHEILSQSGSVARHFDIVPYNISPGIRISDTYHSE